MTPLVSLLIGFIISGVIVYFSYKFGFLSFSGSLSAVFVGTIVLGFGGLNWGLVLLWFFVSSSLLSRIGKKQKVSLNSVREKGDRRDVWQVLANGSVASILVICHLISPEPIWYFLFISTMAAVTADTWGTEIGALSKSPERSIINFKKVPKGTSGGISFVGTLASLLGSFSLTVVGILSQFAPYKIRTDAMIFICLAGFLASLGDSFLGATIQSRYACSVCNKITERKIHCNQKTSLEGGLRFINNEVVNFLCSLFGLEFGYIFWVKEDFS